MRAQTLRNRCRTSKERGFFARCVKSPIPQAHGRMASGWNDGALGFWCACRAGAWLGFRSVAGNRDSLEVRVDSLAHGDSLGTYTRRYVDSAAGASGRGGIAPGRDYFSRTASSLTVSGTPCLGLRTRPRGELVRPHSRFHFMMVGIETPSAREVAATRWRNVSMQ